jgi:ABC-2 type transport system ATP-binding protein
MSSPQRAKTPDNPQPQKRQTADRPVARVGGEPVIISARRLSLWYGQVIGVNDISIDIGPGVTGLLGPNGAGKSTLLKILSGQLRPSTGTARMFGEPIWNNSAIFSRVGLVPEQDAFYEEMSGHQFVTYLTRLQGYTPAEAAKRADETIDLVGLSDDKHRAIEEYSKGMRQRIKLAQALSHDPDILFMDEPLTGTDPVGRHKMIDLVQELGDAGKTIIVSSHVLHEVEQMTRDILLINKGRVLAEGNIYKIRELIDEHPHTIFIDCDAPRKFAALLTEYDDVVRIEFNDDGFQIATRNPDSCYPRIPQLAREHDIVLDGFMSPDNDLMSVFEYLVK